jgi:hypothetical protein
MTRATQLRFLTVVWLAARATIALAASLTPEEAASHVGETATICGLVASTTYLAEAPMAPTFIDIGKAYPNELFSAIILDNDRAKFAASANSLRGRSICVTGEIFLYQGAPKMMLRDPSQLSVQ